MRLNTTGINVVDDAGVVHGVSQRAAERALLETALTRVVLPAPVGVVALLLVVVIFFIFFFFSFFFFLFFLLPLLSLITHVHAI